MSFPHQGDDRRSRLDISRAESAAWQTSLNRRWLQGVASFAKSFDELIDSIDRKRKALASA